MEAPAEVVERTLGAPVPVPVPVYRSRLRRWQLRNITRLAADLSIPGVRAFTAV